MPPDIIRIVPEWNVNKEALLNYKAIIHKNSTRMECKFASNYYNAKRNVYKNSTRMECKLPYIELCFA